MDALKTWLTSASCAALICAIAVAMTPKGTPRKVAKFTGGLLILLAVMGPVGNLDLGDLAQALSKYRYGGESSVMAMAQENGNTRKSIIERETAAYISDKAASLGLTEVKVTVECTITEEGYPMPERVRVSAAGDDEAWSALQRAITADFAIDEQGMTLERTEGT